MMNDKNSFLQVPGFKPMSWMSGRAALTLTAFRHFQRSPVLKLLANPLRDLATYSSKSLLNTSKINTLSFIISSVYDLKDVIIWLEIPIFELVDFFTAK